jgi:GTPase SAR1 family protein
MKPGIISLCEITKDNDAFIVVYSITDKSSFQTAIDLLKSVRISENNRPMILVGNKSDLVRKRAVNREGKFFKNFKGEF